MADVQLIGDKMLTKEDLDRLNQEEIESWLSKKGFVRKPHTTFASLFSLDIGREREILVIGGERRTEESVLLSQPHYERGRKSTFCVHNPDYDGPLSDAKLDAIVNIFKKISLCEYLKYTNLKWNSATGRPLRMALKPLN